jgi:hypothetical protein
LLSPYFVMSDAIASEWGNPSEKGCSTGRQGLTHQHFIRSKISQGFLLSAPSRLRNSVPGEHLRQTVCVICNCFFEACSAFTHVMACTLAESPSDPLNRELRQLRCLRCRFDCYRVELTSSRGRDRAEARALRHESQSPRFPGPPCNPGRSDFPIPVLALACPERPFRNR